MGEGIALVTGASGFVGTHLCRGLRALGRSVRGFSRSPAPAADEWIRGDIRDAGAVAAAARGVETVFHVAGLIPGLGTDAAIAETNVGGSRNVADACLSEGVGVLVLVSSVSAYRAPLAPVIREDAPLGGVDAYGRSKADAEAVVLAQCRGRIRFALARPCQVFGPGDGTGYTDRLLRMLAWPALPLVGGAHRPYSLVHVDDLVQGLLAAETGATPRGEAYNLAAASPTHLLEMARMASAKHKVPRVIPVPGTVLRLALSLRWFLKHARDPARPSRWRSYLPGRTDGSLLLGGPVYDIGKAQRDLGYRPEVRFAEALRDLAECLDGQRAMRPRRSRAITSLRP